ncbi:MAG: LacI family DNA-binding transcriptional regulator, partial [Anaerolineae bacterium]|nr:LacI family DNA-binding transcriptional regulator [Anaerolineae bacterium]
MYRNRRERAERGIVIDAATLQRFLCLTTIRTCAKLGTGSTDAIGSTENAPVPVTIYDVAKEAGVGVGTVSRVLNNNPRVSNETRQRVSQVIERLNFHPSPIAQRLSLR